MSDCKNKDCKDCNEDYLQGMQPCVTLPELCVDGETCEETYNANCVRYTGSPVVCGTTTVLSTGMTTQQALTSLANAICLSGGGGLTDLTALEQCCATNTTNITNLQTNLSIVNSTLTTISTQISTINTQITALQECCDNSVKRCDFFDPSYVILGCSNGEDVFSSDMFYVDKMNAGMSPTTYTQQSNTFGGRRLPLDIVETASAFSVDASWITFGLSWRYPVENEYYNNLQAISGRIGVPDSQTYLLTKNVTNIVGVQGTAGATIHNNNHINGTTGAFPLLMTSIGLQGVASLSNIANIGGDFLSLWRGFQSAPNTAIRGKANGSDLNSGYDIEVGLTTDANRTNVGGKIVVKSGAGGTNHGLKIDVTQALGVTYAVQLKDTTAAAGKFLKAVDSDGNAIWDTVSAGGTVPPGVVSNNNINGTPNYVTKWIAADKIGDSLIQDDGTSLGIGVAPNATALLQIESSTLQALSLMSFSTGSTSAMYVQKGGSGFSNFGIIAYAQGATFTNIGINGSATTTNGTIGIGGKFQSTGAGGGQNGSNYAVQLVDGTETVNGGKYLRDMGDGKANWANINITEVTNGLSSTLLGAPNGIATLDNNSKLVMSQMPISVMDYKGTFNPTVPSPALQDGVGNTGDVYAVTAAGTYTFGAGNILTLGVGDWVIYNGTKWEKTLGNNVGAGTVTSVGLTVGTTGSDVNVSNSPITTSGTITLNIPTIGLGTATRGLLRLTDYTVFYTVIDKAYSSGATNYIPKFGINTKELLNSLIYDTGTKLGFGTTTPTAKFEFSSTASSFDPIIKVVQNFSNTTPFIISYDGKVAINHDAPNHLLDVRGSGQTTYFASTGGTSTYALYSLAKDGIGTNAGITSKAESNTSGTYNKAGNFLSRGCNVGGTVAIGAEAIGVAARAEGALVNIGLRAEAEAPGARYAVQLRDGTEYPGKYLQCLTLDGKANWTFVSQCAQIMCSDMTSIITADNTTPKAIWVAPNPGNFTDAFASLRVPQTGGSIFTVLVKKGSVTYFILNFTNGVGQNMSTNPPNNPGFSGFAKGDIFEIYVNQVGDGSARGLLVTLNYFAGS